MWPFLYPKPNKTLSPSKKNMFIYSSDKTANTFWKELNVILAAMFDITFLMNASGDVVFHSLSCNVHWGMTGGFYGDVCPRRRTWLRARERSGSAQLFFTRSNSTARCPQSEKGLAAPITTRVWGGEKCSDLFEFRSQEWSTGVPAKSELVLQVSGACEPWHQKRPTVLLATGLRLRAACHF